MPFATAKDGCRLHYEEMGPRDGPPVILGYPWNDHSADLQATFGGGGAAAVASLRERNRAVLDGLAQRYRLLRMDYPRGAAPTEGPLEGDLRVETAVADCLAVADHAGVERFALVGYSWSASLALQIATRCDRVAALAIGGWPPLDGPWDEVPEELEAASDRAPAEWRASLAAYARYYRSASEGWNDAEQTPRLTCPRLVFFGLQDETHGIARRILGHASDLQRQGWDVIAFGGLGHSDIPPAVQVAAVRGLLDRNEW